MHSDIRNKTLVSVTADCGLGSCNTLYYQTKIQILTKYKVVKPVTGYVIYVLATQNCTQSWFIMMKRGI